jgi:acyl-CoA synthetase (AMP-forming)/AMP-acid ligase II
MLDGELFVLGRIADSLKVRGRPVYAESLEIVLASALELPTSKCAVVASHEAGSEAVTAIVEANPGEWADCALQALRIEVGPSVNITVYATGPRSIPRTTSGKPRRRELSRRLHAGELAVELVARAARPDVIGPAA